jgi:hypothetical protein
MEPLPIFENNENINDHQNNNENNCSICLDNMIDENFIYTIPECNHKFHTNCIIEWFRTEHGNCPLCRGTPGLSVRNRKNLLSIILNYAKRKNAPKQLVKMVDKYKKLREAHKTTRSDMTIFKRTNKEILNKYRKLRSKNFNLYMKLNASKRELSSLPVRHITIPRK